MLKASRMPSVVAVSTALICSTALPAAAATPAPVQVNSTSVTVTVEVGAIAISAPTTTEEFGAITPGASKTVTLGEVRVTDNRAGMNDWTVTVASAGFKGATDATRTIPASAMSYTSPRATVTGTAVVTPPLVPVTLSATGQVVQTATAVVGNNIATWRPELTLNIPLNTVKDTYTAHITHSFL